MADRETIPAPEPGPRRAVANPPELQADIEAGLTGDKVDVFDPAAAPLGTDEEAAGTPLDRAAVARERAIAAEPKSWREPYVLEAADRAASHETLAEDAARRFSPGVVFAMVCAVAMLAIVFAFLSGRA